MLNWKKTGVRGTTDQHLAGRVITTNKMAFMLFWTGILAVFSGLSLSGQATLFFLIVPLGAVLSLLFNYVHQFKASRISLSILPVIAVALVHYILLLVHEKLLHSLIVLQFCMLVIPWIITTTKEKWIFYILATASVFTFLHSGILWPGIKQEITSSENMPIYEPIIYAYALIIVFTSVFELTKLASFQRQSHQSNSSSTPQKYNNLHPGHELFDRFISQSSEGICLYYRNGQILEWNAGCEVYCDIPYEEAIHKYIWEIAYEVSPEKNDKKEVLTTLKYKSFKLIEEVKGNKTKLLERKIINRKNEIRYISISLFPIITGSQELFGAIIKDMTKIKKYEAELSNYTNNLENLIEERNTELVESERKFRQLAENINDVLVTYTSENEIIYTSPNFQELIGRDPSVFKRNPKIYFRWTHPSDSREVAKLIQEGIAGKRDKIDTKHRLQLPSGELKWVWLRITVIKSQINESRLWLATFTNITQQKQFEQQITEKNAALESYENKLRGLFSMMRDGFVRTDLDGHVQEYNEAFCRMTGCTPEYLQKASIQNITPKKYHEKDSAIIQNEVLKKDSSQLYEKEFIRENGQYFPAEVQIYLIREQHTPVGFWLIIRDITDRLKAQQELMDSETTYREIYNATTDAIFIHDVETGKIIDVNNAMLHMYGYTYQEAININVSKISDNEPPFSQKEANELFNKALQAQDVIHFEWYDKRKNGERFWTHNAMRTATINGVKRLIVISRDITGKRQAEMELENYRLHLEDLVKQRTKEIHKLNKGLSKKNKDLEKALEDLKFAQTKMVQSEKMISIGMLTAGIAHEINNPINFINTGVEGLKMTMDDLRPLIDTLNKADKNEPGALSEKLIALINQNDFKDIAESIGILLKNIETGINRTSEIIQSLRTFSRSNDNEYDEIDINDNIRSTLVILYHNYKNRITIHTNYGNISLIKAYTGKINQVLMNLLANAIQAIDDKGLITIETGHTQNEIYIKINDTGKGILAGDQNKIFEPFYTTKPVGEGTGLGLSITRNIIDEHNGRIEYTSIPNQGTEFLIRLPLQT